MCQTLNGRTDRRECWHTYLGGFSTNSSIWHGPPLPLNFSFELLQILFRGNGYFDRKYFFTPTLNFRFNFKSAIWSSDDKNWNICRLNWPNMSEHATTKKLPQQDFVLTSFDKQMQSMKKAGILTPKIIWKFIEISIISKKNM